MNNYDGLFYGSASWSELEHWPTVSRLVCHKAIFGFGTTDDKLHNTKIGQFAKKCLGVDEGVSLAVTGFGFPIPTNHNAAALPSSQIKDGLAAAVAVATKHYDFGLRDIELEDFEIEEIEGECVSGLAEEAGDVLANNQTVVLLTHGSALSTISPFLLKQFRSGGVVMPRSYYRTTVPSLMLNVRVAVVGTSKIDPDDLMQAVTSAAQLAPPGVRFLEPEIVTSGFPTARIDDVSKMAEAVYGSYVPAIADVTRIVVDPDVFEHEHMEEIAYQVMLWYTDVVCYVGENTPDKWRLASEAKLAGVPFYHHIPRKKE